METPLEKDYELKDIRIESIDFGDRIREKMGDIAGLANDIMEHGVISPICVVDKRAIEEEITSHEDLDPDRPFLLVAGERRTRAAEEAGNEQIPAKVFTRLVSEYEARTMELHENLHRKEMTPYEEAKAKEELHKLYQRMRGETVDSYGGGQTLADTAEMIGQSKATMSLDLEIAKWGEEMEEVRNAESRSEARRAIKRKKEQIAAEEKSKRLEEKRKKQEKDQEIEVEGSSGEVKKFQKQLTERYKIGNYFDLINDLPDGSIDILELDPDWGIDFIERRADNRTFDDNVDYEDIPPEAYEETLEDILKAAYPKLKDHAWLLCWYSIPHWQQETYNILESTGFTVCPMPAFWVKDTGNTATPAYRLGESIAGFFYARKGNPRISNMGRNNAFKFRHPKKNERIHPAEKPVELYQEILNTFGDEGQVVVSGFAGSGNALLAAENLRMNSIGFEMSEEFYPKFKVRVFDEEPGDYSTYESA